jgi:2-polyprenyl-3-methyl-5-hydroxy-6-metoxy-1,4-benzoquinol methylase
LWRFFIAQVARGLRGTLKVPRVYDAAQALVGAYRAQREFANVYVRAEAGYRVVDIGCGTGRILDALPEGITYHGFDLSESYINQARAEYGSRGTFTCAPVSQFASDEHAGVAHLAIAIGVLHHLDDVDVTSLYQTAYEVLRPGGRLVTIDPTFAPGQSWLSRFLVSTDRGRNVRTPREYVQLTSGVFPEPIVTVRHDLLRMPYSQVVLEFTKA